MSELQSVKNSSELAGKYLTFKLANEEYGIEILKVVEIIKLMEVTEVPRTPDYVRGVINLRGKVIPVVELRTKFSMDHIEDTEETCIIVVNVETTDETFTQMGILVDTVSEVLEVRSEDIEPPPQFGSSVQTDFITAMAKAKNVVIMLLDINRVLTSEELANLAASR